MASSTATNRYSNEPPREICRFFLSNTCRFGDKCFYSHDQSNTQSNNICRYYLRGQCIYGDRCRFDHIRPKSSSVNVNRNLPTKIEEYPGGFRVQSLCPYAEKEGHCEALDNGHYCPYIHGDVCDLCALPVLHPTNESQREQHRLECFKKHEANCEEAFAIQRSQDKKCGICLETVWDRDGDRRFGMLENCHHIFCLECIRTWRSSSNYEHKVVKACPECRTKSDFVTPTKYWPENDQAKKNLIQSYKDNLQKIHCKFFKRGDGLCPFGSKCFYLHMDRQGQHVELGPPHRRRQRLNLRGDLENLSDVFLLSLFSPVDVGRFFDEFDFLFDDDEIESYESYFTDEDELRFVDEHDSTDYDEEYQSWH